jgi:hypothetical protein
MPHPILTGLLCITLFLPLLACTAARSDDDDAASDDDDTGSDDDDAVGDCWQASTLLDVASAPGPGAAYASPWITGACEDETFTVESNGIPHYTFVPLTPNALVEAEQHWEIPTAPVLAASPTDIPLLGVMAFTVGGTSIFGPNEGQFPDAFGDPIYNAITDGCTGHTAFEYHNHALSQKCLTTAGLVAEPWTLPDVDSSKPSPILGWALDGFPIYGPYGCLDKDCAEVAEMTSGWVQITDPSTYAWDAHEFVTGGGATVLDQCNGRVQPDGSYGYHATATFPYILGCFSGTAENVGGGENRGGDDDDDVPGGGPTPCEDESDCKGECPDGALGCTCHASPMGQICVPTCDSDSDCDFGGPMNLVCNEDAGICVPG